MEFIKANRSSKKISEIKPPDSNKRNVIFSTFQKELTKKGKDLNALIDNQTAENQNINNLNVSQEENKEGADQLLLKRPSSREHRKVEREDSFNKSGLNNIRLLLERKSQLLQQSKQDSEIAKLIKNINPPSTSQNMNNAATDQLNQYDISSFKIQADMNQKLNFKNQILNEENSVDMSEEGEESEIEEEQFNILGDSEGIIEKSKEYTNEAVTNLEK